MTALKRGCFFAVSLSLLIWTLAGPFAALAQEAPDARTVYGPTLPSTTALYALDPELVAGWNTPLRPYEKKFIPEKYRKLPVLGGWYGKGFIPDREVLMASGVKKAFFVGTGFHDRQKISESLEQLGMK